MLGEALLSKVAPRAKRVIILADSSKFGKQPSPQSEGAAAKAM